MKNFNIIAICLFLCTSAFSQATYTWSGPNNGSWATATNWTPTRTTPQNNDQLVITTNTNLTITGVPCQTIGTLSVQKANNNPPNRDVTLQSATTSSTLYLTGNGGLYVGNRINLACYSTTKKVNFKMSPVTRATIMGTFDGHDLTLESSSTNTASILSDTNTNNNKITLHGTTRVAQYLKGGQWHYITSPIPDAVSNTFLHDYLRYYDEAAGNWSPYIVPTNIPLPVGKGYEVWTQNNLDKVDTFYSSEGLNNGQIIHYLTRTPSTGGGYNLTGNPYPSSIDWESQELYAYHMLPNCWVLDYDINGNYYYKVYIGKLNEQNSDSINGGSRFIAPMQGFFVKVEEPFASGFIELNNSCRRHTSSAFYKETRVATPNYLRLRVEGNNASDETVIKFNNDVTGNPNYWLVEKWLGSPEIPQIYSLTDNNDLKCINTFPESDVTTVKVGLSVGVSGNYTLTATQLTFSNEVTLEDTKLNTFTHLNSQPVYSFTADTADNPDRFLVHFGSTLSAVNTINHEALNIYSYNRNVYITNNKEVSDVFIYDILGKEVLHSKIVDETTMIPTNFVSGTYIIRVISKSISQNKKVNLITYF